MSRSVWTLLQEEGATRLEELREQLETATPENLPRLQGEIRGIRWFLDTPARVKAREESSEFND